MTDTLAGADEGELQSLEEAAAWRRRERAAELREIVAEYPDLLAEYVLPGDLGEYRTFLTVPELARRLGFPVSKTYRLLARGLIPGAFKTDDRLAKSRWIIPPDCVDLFR
jgi:Helix-turn-helix domain